MPDSAARRRKWLVRTLARLLGLRVHFGQIIHGDAE